MRRLAILGLAMIGMAHSAVAADYDYPVLRGSQDYGVPAYKDWSGFYFGGHVGFSNVNADFGDSSQQIFARLLRFTILEEEFGVSGWLDPQDASGNGASYGAFIGYNWQSEDALFGIDFTYSRLSASASSTDIIGRIAVSEDEYQYEITASGTLAAKITDLLTMRARGGVAIGSFLPYLTLGVAVGRVDIIRSIAVSYPPPLDVSDGGGQPPLPGVSLTASDSKKGAFAYGLTAGLGFDWELINNFFLRAEYEYVAFAEVEDVKLSVHTARAGLGVRF